MLPPAQIHALVIGIDEYLVAQPVLTGAVADARRFADYLGTLKIPSKHIKLLTNRHATRSGIISALESMREDDRIEKGNSAIIIYYAGHGSSSDAPGDLPSWQVVDGRIEQLCPVDIGVRGNDGEVIEGIPDRTIRILLDRLSEAKGNNITLILDCCHSAGMNRAFSTDWTARYISKPPPISGAVDRHLCSTASRGLKISKDLQAMASSESHILLAACSSKQYARESKCAGHFTTALLEVLMKHPVHTLTYMSLINRLVMPIVKSSDILQTPHCEGRFSDRRLFDFQTPGADRAAILCVRHDSVLFILAAGKHHGVTEGSEYKIFQNDLLDDESSCAFEIARVKSTSDLTSVLEILQSCGAYPAFIGAPWISASTNPVPPSTTTAKATNPSDTVRYARLSKSTEILLRLHCSNDAYIQRLGISSDGKGSIVAVDQPDEADLVLKLDGDVVEFERGIHTKVVEPDILKRGLSTLLSGTSDTSESSLRYTHTVIDSYAQFLKHFKRTVSYPAVDGILKVEVKRVEWGSDELIAVGDNLLHENSDTVSIIGDGTSYGLTLKNVTSVPLYVHAFVFSPDTSEIYLWYRPPQSHGIVDTASHHSVDTPLESHQTLTLGFGNGGAHALRSVLDPEKSINASFVKVFVSSRPTDMACLAQPSPFRSVIQSSPPEEQPEARELLPASKHAIKRCDGPAPCWKSITFIETHPENVLSAQAPASKEVLADSDGIVEPPPIQETQDKRGLPIVEGSRSTEPVQPIPGTGWLSRVAGFILSPIQWLWPGGRSSAGA